MDDGAGNGGPGKRCARRLRQGRRPIARIGFSGDARPGQDGALIFNACPFNIDQANGADHAAANGGNHRRIGHRIAIAFALQLCLILINGTGHINSQHQRDINRFLGARPAAGGKNGTAGCGQKRATMHGAAPYGEGHHADETKPELQVFQHHIGHARGIFFGHIGVHRQR